MSRLTSDTGHLPAMAKESIGDLPRIDYNMRQHKLAIAINWAVIFISSGVSPNVLYFALRYAAHVKLGTSKPFNTSPYLKTLMLTSSSTWCSQRCVWRFLASLSFQTHVSVGAAEIKVSAARRHKMAGKSFLKNVLSAQV